MGMQEDKVFEFFELVEDIVDSMDQKSLENSPVFSVLHELSLLA